MKFRKSLLIILVVSVSLIQFIPIESQEIPSPQPQSDNSLNINAIYHNTRDGYYRFPGFGTITGYNKTGAVPVGTNVTLRLRTAQNDATEVKIITTGKSPEFNVNISMQIYETKDGFDYWQGNFPIQYGPNECTYLFEVMDGSTTTYFIDDVYTDNVGGLGTTSSTLNNPFPLIIYASDFHTPFWHRNLTVAYQIFIDRFFNGDTSNDALGDGSSGDILWYEWDKSGNGAKESNEQRIYATQKSWSDTSPGLYDFYGGDLQGVWDKIDYLKNEMNVEMIWFNPFMEGPDNHGYSIDNYYAVDPNFGVLEDRTGGRVINNVSEGLTLFENVALALEDAGIKIVADMVLNHVSAQSEYFQRFENLEVEDSPTGFAVPDYYPTSDGAYENSSSDYYDWFHFSTFNHNYDKFDGQYDHIPVLQYDQTSEIEQELITGMNSVFTFWSDLGVDGFRLDVNQDYQDGNGSRYVNEIIRDKVKSDNTDSVIIGEVWNSLLGPRFHQGNMLDGMQNQEWMWKTRLFVHETMSPVSYANFLLMMQELYPSEARNSMWSVLGTHDTSRIFTEVFGLEKEMKNAVVMQMTLPGVPMVYYGDEIGMHGGNDPNNRRSFVWDSDSQNQNIHQFYKDLIGLRKELNALRLGGFEILDSSNENILTYARFTDNPNDDVVIVAINKYSYDYETTINLGNLPLGNRGNKVRDHFTGNIYRVDGNGDITITVPTDTSLVLIGVLTDSPAIDGFSTGVILSAGFFGICIALVFSAKKLRKSKL